MRNEKMSVGSRQKTASNWKTLILSYCFLPIAYFSAMLMPVLTALSQPTIEFNNQIVGLGKEDDNVIQNATYLEDFFENLYQLKTKGDCKISIVHIGDSHIQGDYLTQPVRKNFQEHFGNAGRGLIVPGKVAGTNDAFNIVTSSTIVWNSKRCIYPDHPLPIGIGGVTINTDQLNANLEIYMNDLWSDYSFNTVTLFFQKDDTSFNFLIKDTASQEIGSIDILLNESFGNYSRIGLPYPVDRIRIETVKSTSKQSHATIFGLALENGKNGILYHSIGVNGAKYKHFNAAIFFSKQTTALNPEIFIISLGTNEALDYPYLDRNFYSHVDDLINSLQKNNPQAKFILVTPPDAFQKGNKPSPGIVQTRELIIRYAVENGLAFWDLHKAMGGENAAQAWRECGWLRPDGIHFTKDGYEYQGNLLFHAIIKSYNQYVRLRHP